MRQSTTPLKGEEKQMLHLCPGSLLRRLAAAALTMLWFLAPSPAVPASAAAELAAELAPLGPFVGKTWPTCRDWRR